MISNLTGQKMLRKALKLFGWLGMGVLVLAVVAFVAVSNSEALQDRLVAVGVQNNVAPVLSMTGAVTIWKLLFAARHRPWAMARARNNASLFSPVTNFSLSMQARVRARCQ